MRKRIIKVECSLLGHVWLKNFPSLENRIICKRCNSKMELNLRLLEWEGVQNFSTNLGTDEEIKKRWFRY